VCSTAAGKHLTQTGAWRCSGEESEAESKEEEAEGGEDEEEEFVTERKQPNAKVRGAGGEQDCVGAVLHATSAGGWWFGLVQVGASWSTKVQ
jgi:hypothetical protein